MNMSTALNNAIGGLTAASRGAAVVSGNIANALTPGYARRSLELATSPVSGNGVQIVGITRHQDPVLTASRRNADAQAANTTAVSGFYTNLEKLVGTADDSGSIINKLAEFESSLITAASLPGSKQRLDDVVRQAKSLASNVSEASEGVRQLRSQADRAIGSEVEKLNRSLTDIEALNAKISTIRNSGGDVGALLDQRQGLIDQINELIPVNAIARENDGVSLYSDGGLILLEGSAAEFTFSVTGETMPHMSVSNGLLSGLEINGQPVRTTGENSGIRGGKLAAQFEIRDNLAVEAQSDLDAVARDLIERFENPGLDPTVSITDAGVFTDRGSRFDPTATVGLAGRIEINSLIDPGAGGDSWKLRSGLGAAGPGDPGDARQLSAFGDALTEARPIPGAAFGTANMSAAEIAEALMSKVGTNAHYASEQKTQAASAQLEMQRIEAEQGVDTDTELQHMMRIEQAYSANARILSVVDELMQTLLRI